MRLKLLAAAGLSAALVFSSVGMAFAEGHGHQRGFQDLGKAAWAESAITLLAGQGLVNGVSSTQFAPQQPITLGQLAVILMRYKGQVRSGQTFSTQVKAAGQAGLFSDVGTFSGERADASRAQAMAMIMQALHLQGNGIGSEMRVLAHFHDNGHVPGWARKPLALAVQLGLLEGSAGSLLPNDDITRAQLAVILQRVENELGMSSTAQNSTVRGTFQSTGSVSGSSGTQQTITLSVYGGGANPTQETFNIAANAQIFYGNQQGALSNFQVGDTVFVTLDQSGDASVIVDVQGAHRVAAAVEGSVYAIGNGQITIQPSGGDNQGDNGGGSVSQNTTYTLSPSVQVVVQGSAGTLSDVKPGDLVRVVLDSSGNASMIIVRAMAETVTGTVVMAREDWLWVQTAPNSFSRITSNDATQVTLNGQTATLRSIAVGDQVTAQGFLGEGGLAAQTITATGNVNMQLSND